MSSRQKSKDLQQRTPLTAAVLVLEFFVLFLILTGCQSPPVIPSTAARTVEPTGAPTATHNVLSRTPLSAIQIATPAEGSPYPPPPRQYQPAYPYPAPSEQQSEFTLIAPSTTPNSVPAQPVDWSGSSACEDSLVLRVDDLPGGSFNPLLSVGGTIRWQWMAETLAERYRWQDVLLLRDKVLYETLAFYGLDQDGRWWLVVVSDLCREAGVSALMPVKDPQQVVVQFYSPSGKPAYSYWLLEGGELVAYRQGNKQAIPIFALSDAPGAVFSVWSDDFLSDLNSDGVPELYLIWGEQSSPFLFQVLAQNDAGYHLIAQIEPEVQFVDLDGDGINEFLRPQGSEPPSGWDVYAWIGEAYELVDMLQRPDAPQPVYPGETNLPRLSRDLYFWRGDSWWVWSNTGGSLEALSQPPGLGTQPCPNGITDREVVTWSPDCRYAVVRVSGAVEGSVNALLDAQSGREISIPGTFTYIRGLSTFAWDPGSRYLIHARADGGEGLHRIRLPGGEVEPLMSMNDEVGFAVPSYFFGAVDPYVLPGGEVGFVVQGFQQRLYPPPGVYRVDGNGRLHMLAEIPPLAHDPQDLERSFPGRLYWSPDGSQFLYVAPTSGEYPPSEQVILLGKADGSAVWDVSKILGDARNFWWRGNP